MKKSGLCLCLCFLICVLLCSCAAYETGQKADMTAETAESEVGEPATQLVFSSTEELLKAVRDAKIEANEFVDTANLASLTEVALPTGIPANYILYKITAGEVTIGFWYLPEEYLVSDTAILEAELSGRHFLFIYPRMEESFESVIRQLYGMSGELISDKYYTSATQVVWDEGGKPYMLYLPVEAEAANSAEASFYQKTMATTEENLPKLCATELITFE